jgi:xanthine dehydrogenase/oxidase
VKRWRCVALCEGLRLLSYQILSTDLVYDCGESLNPLIDVGQVEGAFVMGLGLFLTENLAFDSTSGQLLSVGTFEYKPMFPLDIPQQMTVSEYARQLTRVPC